MKRKSTWSKKDKEDIFLGLAFIFSFFFCLTTVFYVYEVPIEDKWSEVKTFSKEKWNEIKTYGKENCIKMNNHEYSCEGDPLFSSIEDELS